VTIRGITNKSKLIYFSLAIIASQIAFEKPAWRHPKVVNKNSIKKIFLP
jgi:hypothetical protein